MSLIELTYFLLLFLVAVGVGRKLLLLLSCTSNSFAEQLCFSLGLGLAVISLSVMLLGFAHLLYVWSLYLLLAIWGVAGARTIGGLRGVVLGQYQRVRVDWRRFYPYLALFLAAGVLLNLIRALTPVHGAVDPLAYHLALPKIYLEKHSLTFERTIRGSLYPANIEMLYCLAIGLCSGILAQLLHFALGVASAVAVMVLGMRHFSWQAGLWGAVIFYFMPVTAFFSSFGYIDIGLCFFQILAFWALCNWLANPGRAWLVVTALLMGFSMGIKHNAAIMVVAAGGIMAVAAFLKEGRFPPVFRRLAVYAGLAFAVACPWYLRSYLEAGNPVWPFANDLFKGLAATQSEVAERSAPPTPAPSQSQDRWTAKDFAEIPFYPLTFFWRWAFEEGPGSQRATGVFLLALLPGVVFHLRGRRARWLTFFCYGLTVIVVLFVHANPRYALFVFALWCLLAGLVASNLSARPIRWVLQGAFLAALGCDLLWLYQLASPNFPVVLGKESQENFLLSHEMSYRLATYLNKALPQNAVILIQGDVRGYYFDRPYLWDHPDQAVLIYRDIQTPEQLLGRLETLGVTHIVRLLNMPAIRRGMYPEYFKEPVHVAFTNRYLKPVYVDGIYALFEINYPSTREGG